jgi:hypothetical protein
MIGIFQGQGAENRKLVLKSLVSGSKTPTEIAEWICRNKNGRIYTGTVSRKTVKSNVQMITRKKQNGSIPILESKKYIDRDNDKWDLTEKGAGVVLALYSNVGEIYPELTEVAGFFAENAKTILNSPFYKDVEKLAIKSRYFDKDRIRTMKNITTSLPLFLHLMRDAVCELIAQGLNFDDMSNEEFMKRVQFRMAYYSFNIMYGDQLGKAMRIASREFKEQKDKKQHA